MTEQTTPKIKLPPNESKRKIGFTKVTHVTCDLILPLLSTAAQSVFLAIYRQTAGWNKPFDEISNSQFRNFTGISENTVRSAIEELDDLKSIIILGERTKKRSYAINWETLKKYLILYDEASGQNSNRKEGTREMRESDDKTGFTMFSNTVFDVIFPLITPKACAIYLRIWRQTIGWDEEFDQISLADFRATTFIKSDKTIRAAIAELEKLNLIIVKGDTRQTLEYGIDKTTLAYYDRFMEEDSE